MRTKINIEVEINLENFTVIEARLKDMTPIWREIHLYMQGVLQKSFSDGARGGMVRGKVWGEFQRQYIRKDGTVVPAWGGIPRHEFAGGYVSLGNHLITPKKTAKERKRVEGLILARLRGNTPRRVRKGDSLMSNTGELKLGLLMRTTFNPTSMRLENMDDPKKVGRQNDLRPFMFYERYKDVNVIRGMVVNGLLQ